jgi:hypothetical protein
MEQKRRKPKVKLAVINVKGKIIGHIKRVVRENETGPALVFYNRKWREVAYCDKRESFQGLQSRYYILDYYADLKSIDRAMAGPLRKVLTGSKVVYVTQGGGAGVE